MPKRPAAKRSAKKASAKKRAAPKRSAPKRAPARPKKAAVKMPRVAKAPAAPADRVTVENVNVPGYRTTLDATKYRAMHAALRKALPVGPPGLTQSEMGEAVLAHLPQDLFPGGDKAMWWVKSVHLDQEAKGTIKRSATKPLRWWRVG